MKSVNLPYFYVNVTIQSRERQSYIRNLITGYTTALGTPSSAATIPVNLEYPKKDDVIVDTIYKKFIAKTPQEN